MLNVYKVGVQMSWLKLLSFCGMILRLQEVKKNAFRSRMANVCICYQRKLMYSTIRYNLLRLGKFRSDRQKLIIHMST